MVRLPVFEPSGATPPWVLVQIITSMPVPLSQTSYADSKAPEPGIDWLNELVTRERELSDRFNALAASGEDLTPGVFGWVAKTPQLAAELTQRVSLPWPLPHSSL